LVCTQSSTYDHRVWKTGLPVRSAVLKPHAGELVVGWVTTSESSLLHVFFFFIFHLASPSGGATPHNSHSSCPLAIIPLHRTRRTMITTTIWPTVLNMQMQYHVLARFKIAPHPFHALIQVLKQPEKEIPRVQFIIEEIANTETKKMNLDKMEQYCKNLQTVAERDTGTINAAQSVSVFG
ncbi:L-lysine 2-3-aminomutase, partial [Penicillium freii]